MAEDRSQEELRIRLLTPPDIPSWGPSGVRSRLRQIFRMRMLPQTLRTRFAGKPAAAGSDPELAQIVENLELHHRIYNYRWYYVTAALSSMLVAGLALFVDYHIIEADVWTRALADEFGVVPDGMQTSVVFKSLQVVFATLAIHFMLKITGTVGRYALVVIVFVLSTVMVAGLGFIVANNNLAAGASGLKSVEGEPRLGDALSQLGLESAPATTPQKAQGEPSADIIERSGSRCPTGYNKMDSNPSLCQRTGKGDPLVNLDLQDWFVFRSLPEEWRKNAQVNLWLIFATMIFFVITAIAALYLETAERNVRNFIEAFDYNRRRKDYSRFSGTSA